MEIFHTFQSGNSCTFGYDLITIFDTVSWHNASQLVSCANFSIICTKNELKKKLYAEKLGWFFHEKHKKHWEMRKNNNKNSHMRFEHLQYGRDTTENWMRDVYVILFYT